MPRVSVIIPSYRHASFVEECVRSALAQTLTDIEVIVVDDCGGDASVELLRAIDDPRLRVYENSVNLGTYQTQNVALSHARGDWIAVLNSDDRWHPTKLARQLDELSSTGLDWSYTLGRQIDAGGAALPFDQHGCWPRSSVQDLRSLLFVSNRILASSVVFRRGHSLLGELRYCGDWMLALRLAWGGAAAYVDEPLTDWRQHGANSYLPSDKLVAEEILVRMSLAAWLEGGQDFAPEPGQGSPSPGSQEKVSSVSETDEVDTQNRAYPLTPALSPLGGEGALPPSPSLHSGTPTCEQGGEVSESPFSEEGKEIDPHPVPAGHRPLPDNQGEVSPLLPMNAGGGVERSETEGVAAAENALHLSALLILAGHMHEARVWAAKSGNRKRQMIAALPGPLARKLLWKSTEARTAPVPTELLDLESYFRT